MAAELIGGAVVGAVAGELVQAVLETKRATSMFESNLKRLESTLDSVGGHMDEIEQLNKKCNDSPKDGIRELGKILQEGKELVEECRVVAWWNYYKRHHYSNKLVDSDASLCRFLQVNMQVAQLKGIKRNSVEIKVVKKEILERVTAGESSSSSSVFDVHESSLDCGPDNIVRRIFRYCRKRPSLGASFIAIAAWLLFKVYQFILATAASWVTISIAALLFQCWRKKPNLAPLFLAPAAWVVVRLYQINFVTVALWVVMLMVASLFLWGKKLRLLTKEPLSKLGLQITERSAMEMADSFQKWILGVGSVIQGGAEIELFFFASAVAALLLRYFVGSFFGLYILLYIGVMLGMTFAHADFFPQAPDEVALYLSTAFEYFTKYPFDASIDNPLFSSDHTYENLSSFVDRHFEGAAAGELLRAVLRAIDTTSKFKSILKRLESIINSLILKINQIKRLIEEYSCDDLPNNNISELILLLQNGKKLVHECSEVACWNYCKKHQYSKKLVELDASLFRLYQIDLPVEQLVRGIKLILVDIKALNKRFDRNSRRRASRVGSGDTFREYHFTFL
ncbi:hypothetical protein L1049_024268 [Liquidambar formosana]|uniref:RPW8 domain-containing protein n=1 Tax=Liquidambar formosana TaxID=63359 RepID=A0AAP0X4F7_LIQFO